MTKNNLISLLNYIVAVGAYIAALIYNVRGNTNNLGTIWLCLGSVFLCLGSVYLLKANKEKEENERDEGDKKYD